MADRMAVPVHSLAVMEEHMMASVQSRTDRIGLVDLGAGKSLAQTDSAWATGTVECWAAVLLDMSLLRLDSWSVVLALSILHSAQCWSSRSPAGHPIFRC